MEGTEISRVPLTPTCTEQQLSDVPDKTHANEDLVGEEHLEVDEFLCFLLTCVSSSSLRLTQTQV